MGWIFLILGGIVLVDIVSFLSTHIGYHKRREACNRIADDRLKQMREENKALKRELDEIREYVMNTTLQIDGRSAETEECLNTVLEYNQKMRELFYDLKERILLLSDLTADDTDPDELKQKLNLLVECVLQDEGKVQQYDKICKAKRAARNEHTPIDPVGYSIDIGGVDVD